MKQVLLHSIFLFIFFSAKAQDTAILWQNSIGGTTDDYGYYVEATTDGGTIVLGSTTSADGDFSSNFGDYDVLLTKLNSAGGIQWIKNLGGSLLEEGYTVHQTIDGGYFVTGYTRSSDGQIALNNGQRDIWVVKTSALGVIQWENTYGGTSDDRAYFTTQTSDGNYIMAGYTESNDVDVTFNNGGADVWVVKIDTAGTLLWQKSLGGTGGDYASHISQTPDGGYIISAYTDSNNGDVSGYHGGGSDVWTVKINSTGTIQWQNCYGGSSLEYSTAAYSTVDGGYIFLAYTASSDGDITTTHGNFDTWLVKLNSTGTILWQKCLGGTDSDANYALLKTMDGKYIIAGYTYSSDGDVTGHHGGGEADYWIVKADTTGAIEWQTCLGGTGDDQAFSITQLTDSTYVVAGLSASTDGDVIGNSGTYDCWVVRLGPAPLITDINNNSKKLIDVILYPNPSNGEFCFKNLEANNLIEIYDVSGRCILNRTASNTSEKINISDKAKGIYFYRVLRKDGTQSQGKISVQ